MKTKIEIKSIWGSLLFTFEKEDNSIKDTLVEAVKQRADLRGAYLQRADLRGADLRGAYLQGADLQGAYLRGADLRGAYLRGADLQRAYLQRAYLRGADLRGADLQGADLQGAYLQGADLQGAYLQGADLRGAYLQGADLKKFKHLLQIVPEEGSFIGWKKGENECIIKLEIPAEAARHNYLGGRKCRAEFVKVLEIRDRKSRKIKSCINKTSNNKITYEVGKMVYPDKYNPDPLTECSNGIHFFLTKQEAKDW